MIYRVHREQRLRHGAENNTVLATADSKY